MNRRLLHPVRLTSIGQLAGRRRALVAALGAAVLAGSMLGAADRLAGEAGPGVVVVASDEPEAAGAKLDVAGLDAAHSPKVPPDVGDADPQPIFVDIGAASDFPPGVHEIEEHQVFLVTYPLGLHAAFSWQDPQSGCRIVTVTSPEGSQLGMAPPEALFVDPCLLHYYDTLGWLIGEPWTAHRMTQHSLSLMADADRLSLTVNEYVPLRSDPQPGWPSEEEMAADAGAQAWRGRVNAAVPAEVSVFPTRWQTPAGRPRTLFVSGYSSELYVELFVHERGMVWSPTPGLEPGDREALRRSLPQGELVAAFTQDAAAPAVTSWTTAEFLSPDGVHLRLAATAAGDRLPTPGTVADWLTTIVSEWRPR